jgi:hypothetical protein
MILGLPIAKISKKNEGKIGREKAVIPDGALAHSSQVYCRPPKMFPPVREQPFFSFNMI